jgi:hypothetical protein
MMWLRQEKFGKFTHEDCEELIEPSADEAEAG